MNLTELQSMWQSERADRFFRISEETLLKQVRARSESFERRIRLRDALEILAACVVAAAFVYRGTIEMPARFGGDWTWYWEWYVGALACVGVGGSFVAMRLSQRSRERGFETNVRGTVERMLWQVRRQMALSRRIVPLYLLPIGLPLLLIVWRSPHLEGSRAPATAFLAVVFGIIYWLNLRTVKTSLEPKARDLESLLNEVVSQ